MYLEIFDDKDFVKMQEEGNNQKEALIQIELLGMNNYIMNIFYFFSLLDFLITVDSQNSY